MLCFLLACVFIAIFMPLSVLLNSFLILFLYFDWSFKWWVNKCNPSHAINTFRTILFGCFYYCNLKIWQIINLANLSPKKLAWLIIVMMMIFGWGLFWLSLVGWFLRYFLVFFRLVVVVVCCRYFVYRERSSSRRAE